MHTSYKEKRREYTRGCRKASGLDQSDRHQGTRDSHILIEPCFPAHAHLLSTTVAHRGNQRPIVHRRRTMSSSLPSPSHMGEANFHPPPSVARILRLAI